jgi:hypothetical protein
MDVPYQPEFQTVPISEIVSPVMSIHHDGLEALLADNAKMPGDATNIPNQEIAYYEVSGLPRGHTAWIKREPSVCQLLLEVGGEAELLGRHASLQDALQALSNQLTRL